jgi:hypothetical protein
MALMDVFTHFSIIRRERRGIRPEEIKKSNQRVRVLFAMSQYVLLRIQVIQEELEALKKMVIHHQTQIKGLWKDVGISDDDLEEAKKAVFRD